MITRRSLLATSIGVVGTIVGLSGCNPPRGEKEVPDVTISDGGDALAYALAALGERYGEGFSQAGGTEVASYVPDYTDELIYTLCAS
ncbi:MAG: hypothetical protein MR415_07670, partial [Coriobacteriaceae bacterium]|nr:hypothetical protein [Coriobacteriaceae bacterium]MCI7438738.1 hypothetical protein [Coriobacteriaceae bacterium]